MANGNMQHQTRAAPARVMLEPKGALIPISTLCTAPTSVKHVSSDIKCPRPRPCGQHHATGGQSLFYRAPGGASLNISEVEEGVVIEGPRWPEPVEVKKADQLTDGIVHVIGSLARSSVHVDAILTGEELSDISLRKIDCDFSSEAWKVFLGLEAIRYRFAAEYDPLLAMSTSKIEPLPHQIDAVYGHILKIPRIRFLLAHDPGAGKTIMAGLIIKEMKLRHLAKKVLIVAPGHLKDQWVRELKEKFGETFVIADRSTVNALYGESIWNKESRLITSMDFARQDDIVASIRSSQFDLVIIDEAHKMAAYKYGDSITKTSRYKLGEALSSRTEHLLFLTATPHKGDNENFRLFLDLLEPGFYATSEMLEESLQNGENTLFLRQTKENMKDFNGKPLFKRRYAYTLTYVLSNPERELYREVSSYVQNQFGKALSTDKKRNIGFAIMVLQRRLASSSYALWESLKRRRKRLSKLAEDFDKSQHYSPGMEDIDEAEDMNEKDRWKQEEEWEALSVAKNREELEKELRTLDRLVATAKSVVEGEHEIKLQKLKGTMEEMAAKEVDAKILVFTESRDTLEYLEARIRSWGYDVSTIHGGMKLAERVAAEGEFKNKSRVMIATEAAGEGINLQFCHFMINYDIPWNPNRLEQRMGRIHRYGQKHKVHVYNIVAHDTIEGKIFQRLFEKLDEIKSKMGNDRVFDIMGNIYHKKDLAHLLVDAATGAKTLDEALEEIEITIDDDYIQKIHEDLADTLATEHIDFVKLDGIRSVARENRLLPEYTSDFFLKAFSKAGGKVKEREMGLYSLGSIPHPIKGIAEEEDFIKSYGNLEGSYPKVTFSNDVDPKDQDAEFVTFGHPLFESVLEWVQESFSSDLQRGAVFEDPSGHLDGTILFFEGAINDGTGRVAGKRMFSYCVDARTGTVEHVPPSILWDLDAQEKGAEATLRSSIDVETQKAAVQTKAITSLQDYQGELLVERRRQARIKERYGIRSLKKLIEDLDAELMHQRTKRREGANVDIVIRNKTDRQKQYINSKKCLVDLIERERSLTISRPKFIGMVRVLPPTTISDVIMENSESEKAAMEAAMLFEKKHGRNPIDVSGKIGLGYDIKSIGKMETRYIEVKGRYREGDVSLTHNEWFKARHLRTDYYLYVVWNTRIQSTNDLEPVVMRDPANTLTPKEDVHFVISASDIRRAAA